MADDIFRSVQTYTNITQFGDYEIDNFPYTPLDIFHGFTYKPPIATQSFSLTFPGISLPPGAQLGIEELFLGMPSPFEVRDSQEISLQAAACIIFCEYDAATVIMAAPLQGAAYSTVVSGGASANIVLDRFGGMNLLAAGFGNALLSALPLL